MAQHNELGKKGEDEAVRYLIVEGYTIVERNWLCEKYEIDIIASNQEYIVFVEVKTRTSDQWGNPSDAVSKGKIRRIVEAADYYLKLKEIDKPARFDIIAVIMNKNLVEIEHIDDAFFAPVN